MFVLHDGLVCISGKLETVAAIDFRDFRRGGLDRLRLRQVTQNDVATSEPDASSYVAVLVRHRLPPLHPRL